VKKLLAAAACLLLPACAAHQLDVGALSSPSDQIVWEASEKAIKKRDWESARQYLKRIIDAFPQSEHQPDARVALADSYFEAGGTANYVLAVSSYREFLTLYPQHPRSDYAQFRAGEAYFRQKNTPDRDLTTTQQALEEYQKLLDVYPQSSHLEETRARIRECRQSIARSHHLVGFFYQRSRQAWRAAVGRYQIILDDYPDYDHSDEILLRMAESLAGAGRYAEALPHLARLEQEYPKSPFVADVAKLRATFPATAPKAPAPASPPPSGAPDPEKPAPPPAKPETGPPPN
jgi:outer membrane protein assembly factor BamD